MGVFITLDKVRRQVLNKDPCCLKDRQYKSDNTDKNRGF